MMNQLNGSHPWDEWHLTAYVLDELDPKDAAKISDAAKNDPMLAAEIAELTRTIHAVRRAYLSEPTVPVQRLGSSGLEMALQAAANLSANPSLNPSETGNNRTTTDRRSSKRRLGIGLITLAAAASLLLMLWPQIRPTELSLSRHSISNEAELSSSPSSVASNSAQTAQQRSTGGGGMGGGFGGGGMGEAVAGYGGGMGSDGSGGMDAGYAGMGGGIGGGIGGGMGGGIGGGMGGNVRGHDRGGFEAGLFWTRESGDDILFESGDDIYFGMPIDSSRYGALGENIFEQVVEQPLSTFSIDVDTAAYSKCRQLLLEQNRRPPADAVRIEEFINYFDYRYAGPDPAAPAEFQAPFAAHLAVAQCPWQPNHRLVRIALQAAKVDLDQRPAANLVFLIDVSGSMNAPNRLPLVQESLRMLVEQLTENDRVAMVVYAGAAGCVLESTGGDQQAKILAALERLNAGGSTNGGDGIQLAYSIARDHYIPGGINRVILCTDGDFNVGVTNTEQLVDLVVQHARNKTFLTVLGFGMGNTNDEMMERISNQGNGVYSFVDSWREAKRQMVQQLAGNLVTVAKDVKIQVEFNPQRVQAYRLLGYENRVMAAQDFDNDLKDAGEIGAGHRVTALYEIVPAGQPTPQPIVDQLRYQTRSNQTQPETGDSGVDNLAGGTDLSYSNELLAVKLRFKEPEGDTSQLRTFPLEDSDDRMQVKDADFRWAAAMAEFGMLLRNSRYKGKSNWTDLIERATAAADGDNDREEAIQMIRRAATLP